MWSWVRILQGTGFFLLFLSFDSVSLTSYLEEVQLYRFSSTKIWMLSCAARGVTRIMCTDLAKNLPKLNLAFLVSVPIFLQAI